jgi:hypothetical protein
MASSSSSFDLSTAAPVDEDSGAFDLSTAKPVADDKTAAPDQGTDWARQAALTGRAAAKGAVTGLTWPLSILQSPVSSLTGEKPRTINSPADLLGYFLDKAGAPSPQSSGEKLAAAGIQGLTGALGAGGTMGVSGIPNALRAGAAGTTGGLSQEGARQTGLPPWMQMGAGLLGSQLPALGESSVRTLGDLISPLTAAGQSRAAGGLLNTQAQNPSAAQANLWQSKPTVPGSEPTAGAASQDTGLLGIEKAVRGTSSPEFGERLSAQNAARQAELTALGGTANDLKNAIKARGDATAPLYAAAATQSAPIDNEMIALMQRPAMQSAISTAKAMAENNGQSFGLSSTAPGSSMSLSGADLQGMKLALDDMRSTGFTQGIGSHQQRALQNTSDALTDWMQRNVPAQRQADAAFQNLSGPINKMQTVQALQQKASTTAADVQTGQYFLSPASYSRALDEALDNARNGLGKGDITRLEAIRKDLQNSQAVNGPLLKAPGSDTFQNLSLNQNLSGPARMLTKPLDPLYRMGGADAAINKLLTRGMLDPKFAAGLMQGALKPRPGLNFGPYDVGAMGGLLGSGQQ